MTEELRKLSATFIEGEANNTSLITVTNAMLTPDSKTAFIYVTVFPESKEVETLNFLKRKRKELRKYIVQNLKIGHSPFIDIELDLGEKNRQRIDTLLREANK